MGKQYRIKTRYGAAPNSSRVGGTKAGLKCSEPTQRLINHQMGHSQSVHYKYYEKLGGQNKAALALKVRQRLAFDKSNDDEPKQQSESEGSSNEPQKKRHRVTRFHKKSGIQ